MNQNGQNQSQSQSQSQSSGTQSQSQSGQAQSGEPTAKDVEGRQSPGGGSAAGSSSQENAGWAKDGAPVDQATASTEHAADAENTPAGYGDRGQGGQPDLTEGAAPHAEQPDRESMAPDGERARQAGQAERSGGAFVDE